MSIEPNRPHVDEPDAETQRIILERLKTFDEDARSAVDARQAIDAMRRNLSHALPR
jgi:hypothetical protein